MFKRISKLLITINIFLNIFSFMLLHAIYKLSTAFNCNSTVQDKNLFEIHKFSLSIVENNNNPEKI